MRVRIRGSVVAAVATAVVLAGVLVPGEMLVRGQARSGAGSDFRPTTPEAAVAVQVAHTEAMSTVPDSNGGPMPAGAVIVDASGWPANVQKVVFTATMRSAAKRYIRTDNSGDPRKVVIVQLEGDFTVVTAGPDGSQPFAHGTLMTVVADAVTGEVLDGGLETAKSTHSLTDGTVIFDRH